jgi:hypothetical protein
MNTQNVEIQVPAVGARLMSRWIAGMLRTSIFGAAAFLAAGLLMGCIAAPVSEEESAETAVGVAEQALTNCNPSPNQVAVFYDANFGSSCTYLGVGLYPDAGSTGLPNDSISSIKVGANVKATLFQDWQFNGFQQTFAGDVAYLGWYGIGNDTVSSLRVEPRYLDCQNPPAGAVALFKDANYQGDCVVRYSWETSCGVSPTGAGFFSAAYCTGLANDSISSIKVGSSTWAYLCQDWQMGGYCEWENSNQPFLGWLTVGNDKVSSVRVWH